MLHLPKQCVLIRALRAQAPTGARFDSPGRSRRSPGYAETKGRKAQRAEIPDGELAQRAQGNLAPLGLLLIGGPPTQGSAALRPGLSNLAPFGAFSLARVWNKTRAHFVMKGI